MREMKDSGVPWIGEIPKDWQVSKIGNFFCFHSGETLTSEQIKDSKEENYPYIVYGANGIRGYYTSPNTHGKKILIGRVGALCGNVHIADGDYWVTEHALIAKEKLHLNKEYYSFVFVAMNLGQYSKATAQPVISSETISLKRFPVPSLSEQQRISDFLDAKCTEIDAILENTRASIGEYKKLKQSVITEAVTKGIRGERPMKDSGVEWIGEIPAEWRVEPLWGTIRRKTEVEHPDERVLSLYRDYGVIPKDSRDDNHNVTSLDTSNYKFVEVGDLVVNKMKAWQGSMAISSYQGIVSPAYHVCEVHNPSIHRPYLHYLLRNQIYLPEYLRLSTGMRVGQWDLSYDDLRHIPIIIPDMQEQQEIASYLDENCAAIDALIASKESLIAELESYKKSLIYEYVTGKKEVPAI